MAGVSVTASLSLMVGVAVATSLAVSAILVGPAVIDCAKSPIGLGACLHAELARFVPVASGVPTPAPPVARQAAAQIEADAGSATAPSPAPPVVLERRTGTLGGDAAIPSRAVADISLAPAAGSLSGGGDPEITGAIGVELSRLRVELQASASVDAAMPEADASLSQALGTLAAASAQSPQMADASVELSSEAGEVSAALAAAPDALAAATVLSDAQGSVLVSTGPPVPDVVVSAEFSSSAGEIVAGSEPLPAITPVPSAELAASSMEITATDAPSTASDVSVVLLPSPSIETTPSSSVAPASEVVIEPSAAPPPDAPPQPEPAQPPSGETWASPLVARTDPRFPNVVSLPAPSGTDNSVITLQLN